MNFNEAAPNSSLSIKRIGIIIVIHAIIFIAILNNKIQIHLPNPASPVPVYPVDLPITNDVDKPKPQPDAKPNEDVRERDSTARDNDIQLGEPTTKPIDGRTETEGAVDVLRDAEDGDKGDRDIGGVKNGTGGNGTHLTSASTVEVTFNSAACPTPTPDDYPKASIKNMETGTSKVTVIFGANAQVIDVTVNNSSGYPALDRALIKHLKSGICKANKPAMEDGNPVPGKAILEFTWRLD
jgi:periplasmic protein TonB